MARRKDRTFGQVIRERRRQLDLTQQEVAQRIKTSTPYVGHLESDKRHPSDKVLSRLAKYGGWSSVTYFSWRAQARSHCSNPRRPQQAFSVEFRKNSRLRRIHNLSQEEMNALTHVTPLGEVGIPRDFINILNTVRNALGR
jgi:DNA-binding XRE family transcriptional regulator